MVFVVLALLADVCIRVGFVGEVDVDFTLFFDALSLEIDLLSVVADSGLMGLVGLNEAFLAASSLNVLSIEQTVAVALTNVSEGADQLFVVFVYLSD